MQIAVTGANGFLGSALISQLAKNSQNKIRGLVRHEPYVRHSGVKYYSACDLSMSMDWRESVRGADIVIHTAARVSASNNTSRNVMDEFYRINVEGTLNLARQAADLGVRRLIFFSSIKVNGESTFLNETFTAQDNPGPKDAYGISKMTAEQGLFEVGLETGMEIVCIRPPLVYGPGVKGNFLSLLRWLDSGIPLPLGSIHNLRSLVGVDNLVDLVITCIDHPAAANQVFLVSDDEDLSTTEMLRRMSIALKRQVRLVPVPAKLLKFVAGIIGKEEVAQRLVGSLQIDISKTKSLLNWSPPYSFDEGICKTAKWLLDSP